MADFGGCLFVERGEACALSLWCLRGNDRVDLRDQSVRTLRVCAEELPDQIVETGGRDANPEARTRRAIVTRTIGGARCQGRRTEPEVQAGALVSAQVVDEIPESASVGTQVIVTVWSTPYVPRLPP